MAQASILELLTAFQQEKIGQVELESGLEAQIQLCQRRQEELAKARIQPEDQEVWERDLRPGLDACYEGLIGAASEALEYAKSRNEALVPGIVGLLQEVERITGFLESQAGVTSAATRQLVQQGIEGQQDGLALGVSQGSAESQVTFLEE
ncbi:MAG: hypothetical protein ACAI44_36130 [Candidatus Sericytochromatia bacterium]